MKTKKVLSLLLSIIMLISLLPMSAFAADSKPAGEPNIGAGMRIIQKRYDSATNIMTVAAQVKLPAGAGGITTASVTLFYDSTKLTLLNANNTAKSFEPTFPEAKGCAAALHMLILDTDDVPYQAADVYVAGKDGRAVLFAGIAVGPSSYVIDDLGTDWYDLFEIKFKVAGDPVAVLSSDSIRVATVEQDDELVASACYGNNWQMLRADTAKAFMYGPMSGCTDMNAPGGYYTMADPDTGTMTYTMDGVTQEGCTYGETLPDAVYSAPDGTDVTVTYAGTLRSGSTYGPTGVKPNEAGEYTVTVKYSVGNTNYASEPVSFTIAPKPITGAVVTLGPALAYTGEEQTQTVAKVMLGSDDITAYCDVTGNTATAVGNYTLTVHAKSGSNYCDGTDDITQAFSVSKKTINPEITVLGNYYYTGSDITPPFMVKNDGSVLDPSDYTAVFTNNRNAGTATITVNASDDSNYTFDAISKNFTIAKAEQDAPDAKVGYTLNYEEETLIAENGYEVSTGNNETAVPLPDDKAEPGTTYYVRKQADDNHNASGWTKIVTPSRPVAPDAQSIDSGVTKTDTTITLPYNDAWEYSNDEGVSWNSGSGSNAFSGLENGQTYELWVRVKATEEAMCSDTMKLSVETYAWNVDTTGDGDVDSYIVLVLDGSIYTDESGNIYAPVYDAVGEEIASFKAVDDNGDGVYKDRSLNPDLYVMIDTNGDGKPDSLVQVDDNYGTGVYTDAAGNVYTKTTAGDDTVYYSPAHTDPDSEYPAVYYNADNEPFVMVDTDGDDIPDSVNDVEFVDGKVVDVESGRTLEKYPKGPFYTFSGVTVSGQILSYNRSNDILVQLMKDGVEMYSVTIEGTEGQGRFTDDFEIEGVAPDTYDLVVSKTGHLKYTVEGVVVGNDDLDLAACTNEPYAVITLLAGDINGDGVTSFGDRSLLQGAANYRKTIGNGSGVDARADLNGDGIISYADLTLLTAAANYRKSNISVPFAQ